MNTTTWIRSKVSQLLPAGKADGKSPEQSGASGQVPADDGNEVAQTASAKSEPAQVAPAKSAPAALAASALMKTEAVARTTRERLDGVLRYKKEALSPWVLRRTLSELRSVVDSQVSEVEAGRRAKGIAQWYAQASQDERLDCMVLMSEQFAPDPAKVNAARAQFDAAQGGPEQGHAEIRLRRALVSPRTRLLQRFAVFPEGMRFLVNLRAEVLPLLRSEKRLLALDAELETLFSAWFDVGFLDLRRISWDSPASLIEKLIRYEAVHAIRSWGDVKNRLDSDRRCYGFFHPRLPDEPLIFVEVALLDQMADSMAPLLDESASAADLNKATTAIFYSISNTQAGLRGVSFGDSLIKRVVETLKAEFPKLKVFATLSPIPGLRPWLVKNAPDMLEKTDPKGRARLALALGVDALDATQLLAAAEQALALDAKSPLRKWLLQAAAAYLTSTANGQPIDPVTRFHLGNGARIERLNWAADDSAKGVKQSYGLMVNYVYDLRRLDKHRAMLAKGQIPVAAEIESLAF